MLATEAGFYFAALALYGAAFSILAIGMSLGRPGSEALCRKACALGCLVHGLALGLRAAAGAPPMVSYYESASLGLFLSTLAYLWVSRRGSRLVLVWLVQGPVSLLLMGSAAFSAGPLMPLAPALQSWWLAVHVIFALLAFASLLLAFGLGLLVLWPAGLRRLPPGTWADRFFFRCLCLAFLFQAVMMLAGSIWANQAWGRYWGWDPMETTSLLTLLVYALAIHLRLGLGWRGPRLAALTLVAFALTVYGIWGVPLLRPSLHLYNKP